MAYQSPTPKSDVRPFIAVPVTDEVDFSARTLHNFLAEDVVVAVSVPPAPATASPPVYAIREFVAGVSYLSVKLDRFAAASPEAVPVELRPM
jgi:hypothetical protein